MIPLVRPRLFHVEDVFEDALGRPLLHVVDLIAFTVVAHGPAFTERPVLEENARMWSAEEWVEHLDEPFDEHPFITSPGGDRHAVLHLEFRLHPHDSGQHPGTWEQIAERMARTAGIAAPAGAPGCRWVAFLGESNTLHIVANLIRTDGSWADVPRSLARDLTAEARRLEGDFGLHSPLPDKAPQAPSASLAGTAEKLLAELADPELGLLPRAARVSTKTAEVLSFHPGRSTDISARLAAVATHLRALNAEVTAIAVLADPSWATPSRTAVHHVQPVPAQPSIPGPRGR
ncbi:hypothetical protein OTB20_18820 [Streptomyces sp. H27-H1]|uniref:hypothetical protein n=1 Tax=Streptomyces sp. H27-H1 TaxID=2996461 RepID=UPI00226D8847|nr:hypothetical protein [Streptomyces sp. H27-H1]MCY0928211.1 hypothetical protein [Streptomyces sp. H27-H1]